MLLRLFGGFKRFCLVGLMASLPSSLPALSGEVASSPEAPVIATFKVGSGVYVRSLAVDEARDVIWVGTSAGVMEVGLKDEVVKRTLTRKDGLANEYVFGIGVHPSGDIWFGTNAGGASRLTDDGLKTYFPMHGLGDYWVYSFANQADNKMWLGTWDGASIWDPKTDTFITYRDELINIWVYGLAIDPEGRVWFGTEGGISMLDGDVWSSWDHEDGLGAKNVEGKPLSGNAGLGTRSRHDLNVTMGDTTSYNPNYTFAAHNDNQGRGVWFGTWGGGVTLFDKKNTWTSFSTKDGLSGNIVYSIAQSADGTMWFGTNRGLTRWDGKNFKVITNGLEGLHVYAVAVDPGGSVWAATRGGVTRYTYSK